MRWRVGKDPTKARLNCTSVEQRLGRSSALSYGSIECAAMVRDAHLNC